MIPLLEAALAHRLISKKQYKTVRTELEANSSLSAADLLLQKHYLTEPQLYELLASLPEGEDGSGELRPRPDQPITPRTAELQGHSAGRPTPKPTPAQSPPPGGKMKKPKKMKDLLVLARHWGASDLHVSVGRPPFVRLNGSLRYMETDPLTADEAARLNFQLLTEAQREEVATKLNIDFALELEDVGRHRCNVFRQRLGWDGVYRIIPNEILSFDSLGFPPVIKTLTEYNQGMVLVTGPARSGKTTTLAAMVDMLNSSRSEHIITIEEPIEYVHPPKKCQVTQRAIGSHSKSFGAALSAALHEDPDIILVGEMRDLETISIAVSAAETGHLVLGTLHTGGAARTINRILDVFPSKQRAQIATMISESLRGILSQLLLPRLDGEGLVLALEVLVVTSSVAPLIRDARTHQLTSVMQSGKRHGMQLMDDVLLELVRAKQISAVDASIAAENKALFEPFLDSSSSTS